MDSTFLMIFSGLLFTAWIVFLSQRFARESMEQKKIFRRFQRLKSRTKGIAQTYQFSTIVFLNRFFKKRALTQRLHHLLNLSGWEIPVSIFIFGDLACAGALALAVWALLHSSFLSALTAGAVVFVPYKILVFRKHRYIERFTTQFPDALLMIKNALHAGQSLQSSLQIVAKEGPRPVAGEFTRVIRQIELGRPIHEALNSLYRRIQSFDLKIFVLGIFIQHEVGGNLTDLLEHMEHTIRERLSLIRELHALTAQGKLTGLILMLLPVGFAGIIQLSNPVYLKPLFEESGRPILWAAIGLQILGSLIIRKITDIPVTA